MICPTAVEPDSPESYYLVSDRLAEEIPGGYKPDQYSNEGNADAHYRTTGPEIWEQTGGEVDAVVISVGTGGSITGIARYLKEQNPDLLIVGADPEGSIYSGGPVHPYLVEGIGKDTYPASFDPSVVDEYVRVSDRDSFLTARRLAREEGILAGGSGGTSVFAMLETAKRFGPEATILTTIPDGGRGYLSKLFDDNWMLEHGFLERYGPADTVEQVLAFKHADGGVPDLVVCESHQKLGAAIELMQRYGISQLPVVRNAPAETLSDVVGSLNERGLLDRVFRNPDALGEEVAGAMDPPLQAADVGDRVEQVFGDLREQSQAVVVARNGRARGRADALRPARVPGAPAVKLYNSQSSGNCWKVRQMLALLGIPYERVEVDVIDRSNRRRDPGRQEPGPARADAGARQRRAPRRVERDPLVPRRRHGVRARRPAGARPRAPVDVLRAVRGRAEPRRRAVLDRDPRRSATSTPPSWKAKWRGGNRALDAIEGHLADRDWLVGSAFSIADISVYAYTHVAEEGGFDLAPYPATRAWIERVAGRPGYVPMEA